MNIGNYFITALFLGISAYILWGVISSKAKVIIRDRDWSFGRIMFLVAFVLACVTGVFIRDATDVVRTLATILAIGLFLFVRDGLSEKGIVALGRLTPWSQIRGFDYRRDKKQFSVFFVEDNKSKSNTDYSIVMNFDLKNEEAVKQMLDKYIRKKHIRIKK